MKLDENGLLGIAFIVIIVVAFSILGMTGAKTILAFFAFFALPFFLILNAFSLSTEEKLFFALFIGIAWFSLIVFVINRIVPSFRISTLITLAVLVLLGAGMNHPRGKTYIRKLESLLKV